MPEPFPVFLEGLVERLAYQGAMFKSRHGLPLSDVERRLLASNSPEKMGVKACSECGEPLEPRLD